VKEIEPQANAATEAAKQAFADWWATMEAKGYQYGYEALCNVWVGFEDGREALAQEVITAVDDFFGGLSATHINKYELLTALRAKCTQLGINLHDDGEERG
jgi:hypothetical protein